MTVPSFRRLSLASAALLVTLALGGCKSHIKGKYESTNGMMSVDFRGDKAYVTLPMAGTQQMDFEQDGDRVIIKNPEGNLVLTRNHDGSLSGPMGDLKKAD